MVWEGVLYAIKNKYTQNQNTKEIVPSWMVSNGVLLGAVVRGTMKDDFLNSVEFAKMLRPEYQGFAGAEARKSIRQCYDSRTDKLSLRSNLTKKANLKWHLTVDGINSICNFFLTGIDDANVATLRRFLELIVDDLILLKPAKALHLGFFGLPGVGKSTASIAILQAVLFGSFRAAENNAFKGLLDKQRAMLMSIPDGIREIMSMPQTPTYIYIHVTPTFTPTQLSTRVKEQYKAPQLASDTSTLHDVICIPHFDEVDKVGAMAPAKRNQLVGKLQDIAEGNFSTILDNTSHHFKVCAWSGNFTPLNVRLPHEDLQSDVQLQAKDMFGDKFTENRFPIAKNIVLLQ